MPNRHAFPVFVFASVRATGHSDQMALEPGSVVAEIIADLEDGLPLPIAASKAGVSVDSVRNWARKDAELRASLMRAEGKRTAALWKNIDTTEGDWKAQAWKLERSSAAFREVREVKQAVTLELQRVIDMLEAEMPAESYGHLLAGIDRIQRRMAGQEAASPALEAESDDGK